MKFTFEPEKPNKGQNYDKFISNFEFLTDFKHHRQNGIPYFLKKYICQKMSLLTLIWI